MKRTKTAGRLLCGIWLLGILCVLLSGCSTEKVESITSIRQLDGKTIGVMTGSTFDKHTDTYIHDAKKEYYTSYADMALAVEQGKISAFLMDEPMARVLCGENPGITYLEDYLTQDGYAFAFPKTERGAMLRDQMNEFLAQIQADGTLAELESIWFGTDEAVQTVEDWSTLPAPNGTLEFAAKASSAPFAYVKDGETVGYDVDIVIRFCKAYGYGLTIHNVELTSFIAGIESGKYDLGAAGFTVTEERAERVYFSEPDYEGGIVVVVAGEAEKEARFENLEDFVGTTLGGLTGTFQDQLAANAIPDVNFQYYEDIASQMLALQNGYVDGALSDLPLATLVVAQYSDLTIFPEILAPDSYGLGLAKDSPLTDQVSAIIEGFAADGTLDALEKKWMGADEDAKTIDVGEYDAPNGTLRYVHDPSMQPMSYVGENGQSLGYEVELVALIAKELGMELEITQGNFTTLIPMLVSGRADIVSGSISITEEREQSIDFATAHYNGGVVLVVRAEDLGIDTSETDRLGFWSGLAESFQKTFVQENRWQMILSGLGVTVTISLCAALIGSMLGFGLCLVRRSHNRSLATVAAVFIRLIQGIPTLVLLMVLYYIVFASTILNGVIIAIVAFSINFSVYVSEMIRTGIDAVDNGQWEAAEALGFGRVKTFTKIIAPQAARHTLPVYKGELISMVKMTSVVGYIAVEDLTKATDLIRSRTFEAFFPLIVTAIIYFLLAWALTAMLGVVERMIDPTRRRRELKGIQTADIQQKAEHVATRSEETGPVIQIAHLTKTYPHVTPLKDVNAEIYKGEVISIIGPSGTGKSTLLRCLNRLETPTGGSIRVFSQDLIAAKAAQLGAVRRRMGMVFQSFNLFSHLTIIENIMLGPVELLGCTRQQAYERGMRLLASVGLAEKALSYPNELSGGQKQRAAIARTLGMQPEIVLFDEPTSALDPTMVGEVLAVIRGLAGQGLTMLIVTHEMKFARDVSTRVFYMDEGIVYEEGTPEQVFESPKTNRCRAFVQRLKTFHLDITSKTFDFIGAAADIDRFSRRQLLGAQQSLKYQQIFEELCVTNILPTLPDNGCSLRFDALCREDGSECEAIIRWEGERFDPLTQGDQLSVALAVSRTKRSTHTYADGVNTVTIVF